MHWLCTLPVLTAAALVCSAAQAAQSQGGAFYRCKDKQGLTHFGDSVPPACSGLDTDVLNDRGMVMRVIEGEQSRAARTAREAVEARARREREQREQRDRMLIETYLNVEDIERLRDQRLELLVAQHRLTEQNMASLRERQRRIEAQIARFKPYSENPNAPPLPDHLAEEMVNTVNGLRVYEESLKKNSKEQADLEASFDSDIKRFKELKNLN